MLNHQGSPVLFTQRLRLRPYRAGDGAQVGLASTVASFPPGRAMRK